MTNVVLQPPQRRHLEAATAEGRSLRRRGILSLGMYRREALHPIEDVDAVAAFVGLQVEIEGAAGLRSEEGFRHNTEIAQGGRGIRTNVVAAGGTQHCDPRKSRQASDRQDEQSDGVVRIPFNLQQSEKQNDEW